VKSLKITAFLIAGFGLAACGGGSHATGTLPTTSSGSSGGGLFANGPQNAAPAAGAVTASVSITIPLPKQTSASKRRPKFLSSFTQGIALEAMQNGNPSGYVFYPLTYLQSYCVQNGSGLACSVSVQAPPGQTTILVGAYDSANDPSGNLLSAVQAPETISPGRTNNLTITLLPVAASIAGATPPSRCPVVGTPINASTTYAAVDADGDDLSGLQLYNAITFADVNPSDTNSGFAVSPATIASGSGTLSYTYDGVDTNVGVFQISSNSGPGSTGGNTYAGIFASIPVTVAGPHYVYVADAANNEILQYDGCSNSGTVFRTFTLPASPVDVRFDRNSPANDERLFILMSNNHLTWLDVEGSPGTFIQTINYGANVVQHVRDSDTSAFAWVTVANNVKKYSVTEGAPGVGTLTSINQTILNTPVGFALEGTGNDMLVANTGAGTIQAVNPTNMNADGLGLTIAGPVDRIGGPNSNTTCALASSTAGNSVSAVSIPPLGGSATQIGSTIVVPGPPQALVFFPPATGVVTNPGYGTNTGIVANTNGGAALFTCDGVTFAQYAQWNTFMAQPAAMASSEYSSLAMGSLVYVTGLDVGQPVLQAFISSFDHDLGSLALPAGTNPIAVTVGR
jgi:hypothetical protein